MYKSLLFFLILPLAVYAKNSFKNEVFEIIPVEHGSFVLKVNDKVGYIDPVGEATRFSQYGQADFILLTDIHGDHLSNETLNSLVTEKTIVLLPKAVHEKLGYGSVISNGEEQKLFEFNVLAMPMYNITEGRLEKHVKGRGNGYLIEFGGQKLYISGDTEDIPEMRALKDVDVALLCMNLPFTMSPEQALSATLEFKPKVLIPFHYRGKPSYSDLTPLQEGLTKEEGVELVLLEWYPNRK